MKTGINISIKQRIYWSFSFLVCLFVLNGIITIITINDEKKLSAHLSNVVGPSLQVMEDFESVLIESKMYTTNWVFLRFNEEDKDLLKKLHSSGYPALKTRIKLYSSQWKNKEWVDTLNEIFTGFEQLLVIEKNIMASLKEFKDYDDPVIKLEAERKVEEEILPRTASLVKSLNTIYAFGVTLRKEENIKIEASSMKLRMFIILLAITIICAGFFLAVYMSRLIIGPVNRIRHLINNLGRGIIEKTDQYDDRNEIGKMILSVNNLSEKLQAAATFAQEVGLRNFDLPFKPLSNEDTLGKALIAMRDNIKSSDEKINQAQHIAHLGTLERDVATGRLYLSDEMFNILEIDPSSFDYDFQHILNMVHPDFRDEFKKYRENYLHGSHGDDFECKIITPKGVTKNIIVQSKIVVDAMGKALRIVGIVQDVTERKRAEEKLAEERELFRIMIENIPDQIYVKDIESRFLHCNMPGAVNAGCKSQDDIIGKTDFDFFPLESAKHFFAVEQALMKSGEPIINQEDYVPDEITGEPRWTLNTKVPIKDRNGKMIGLIGINRDITQRKISEKKIEDVNRELGILFNSIDEVFFSVDMVNFKVIQISGTCEKLYGYSQSEFLDNYRLWFEIIHPGDKHVIENEDAEMQRGEQVDNQYRIIRKDNTVRWVETKITPTLNSEGKLVRVDGVTRDITERKRTEQELEKSFSILEATIESTADGILVADFDGRIVKFNKKFVELWRIPKEILDTRNDEKAIAFALQQLTNPEEFVSKVKELYEQRDARSFDILMFKDGRTFERYSQPQLINGNCVGRVWNFRDVTERRLAEEKLEFNNRALEQKNKELEQFAYVASHDLQEPLRTTISFVEIFKQQYFEKIDSKADKYLSYIVQASDRMRVLIEDLLDFSRIGINKAVEMVDCNIILRDIIIDLDKAIKDSGAEIKAEHLPVISGYTTELKQLFQNLILNSIKFRKKSTPLKINIEAHKKNDYWRFAFTDNGIGIDPQHFERIFIIFQRLHTRSEYKGSGIGLSHCKKIVELHHGKIWVESTPNEGSVFYFTIHSPKEKINEPKIKLHHAY